MRFPNVRALIFDLDGTLVDSYLAITQALNDVLAARGLPPRSEVEVRAAVGHGLSHLIGQYLPDSEVPKGCAHFERAYRRVFLETTSPLPGAALVLGGLFERGFRLSVASNKPQHFSREILDHLHLSRFLASVRGPGADLPAKPHPAMLHACLADLGSGAGEALYVGDMVLDVDSGRAAGIPVALVTTGSSPRAALAATGCFVMNDLRELLGELRPRAVPAGTD